MSSRLVAALRTLAGRKATSAQAVAERRDLRPVPTEQLVQVGGGNSLPKRYWG